MRHPKGETNPEKLCASNKTYTCVKDYMIYIGKINLYIIIFLERMRKPTSPTQDVEDRPIGIK